MHVFVTATGYIALLLWGIHMVTTSVKKGFGGNIKTSLGRLLKTKKSSFFAGGVMTIALQSSTAMSFLGASFVADGIVALEYGVIMMLGANVGTALVTKAISFPSGVIAPLCILIGYIWYTKVSRGNKRFIAEAIIGFGVILLSLHGIVSSFSVLFSYETIKLIFAAMGNAPVLAGSIALLLAWACHSSMAVILLGTALLSLHGWPLDSTLALLIGANVGSAVSPLLEVSGAVEKRLPLGNLISRIFGGIVLLCSAPLWQFIPKDVLQYKHFLVDAHVVFNLLLALLCFPFASWIAKVACFVLKEPPKPLHDFEPRYLTYPPPKKYYILVLQAERESLRLAENVETLFRSGVSCYKTHPPLGPTCHYGDLERMASDIVRLGETIRTHTAIAKDSEDIDNNKRVDEILRFVYDMEQLSDITLSLSRRMANYFAPGGPQSKAGTDIVAKMNNRIEAAFGKSIAIFMHRDRGAARDFLADKDEVRQFETISVYDTLGTASPIGHDNLLSTIIRDMKRLHSHLTGIAYQILDHAGQLRSRVDYASVNTGTDADDTENESTG